MKVEIWSDVVCPFCYIGKRRFEQALSQFESANKIAIEWKSFQLSPESATDPNKSINQFLAEHKGISVDEAKRMNDYVTQMAAGVGLKYDFDKVVVANTFNAHRLLHLAKTFNLQSELKEQLMSSYFTQGKNIDDTDILVAIGKQIGLQPEHIEQVLKSDAYAADVTGDIMEARQLGIRGVPFFVFDRKYAISGAQATPVFLETLEKSFSESIIN